MRSRGSPRSPLRDRGAAGARRARCRRCSARRRPSPPDQVRSPISAATRWLRPERARPRDHPLPADWHRPTARLALPHVRVSIGISRPQNLPTSSSRPVDLHTRTGSYASVASGPPMTYPCLTTRTEPRGMGNHAKSNRSVMTWQTEHDPRRWDTTGSAVTKQKVRGSKPFGRRALAVKIATGCRGRRRDGAYTAPWGGASARLRKSRSTCRKRSGSSRCGTWLLCWKTTSSAPGTRLWYQDVSSGRVSS